MKYSSTILLLLIVLLLTSCVGKGKLVDKELSDSFYYSRDKTKIWYKRKNAPDVTALWDYDWLEVPADAETFQLMPYGISKDKNHIFRWAKILEDVDYQSFAVDEEGVVRDKNNIYLTYGGKLKLLKEANAASYHKLKLWKEHYYISPSYDWAKDDTHYFYRDSIVPVDYNSFEILTRSLMADKDYIYSIDNHRIVTIDNKEGATDNFEVLDSQILHTSNYFYFRNYADRGEILEIPIINTESIKMYSKRDYFAIDSMVYYKGIVVENADFESFDTFDKGDAVWFAKDKNYVYKHGKVIPDANPKKVVFNDDKGRLEQDGYTWKWSASAPNNLEKVKIE